MYKKSPFCLKTENIKAAIYK